MPDSDHPVEDLPLPSEDEGPGQVVARQVAALADNDDPYPDAGILTAYNFASPANRRQTGPRDRFVRMVESPPYDTLVDHAEAVSGPVEREENYAEQRLTVTGADGRTRTYEFGLSLQSKGRFRGCWLTDRVLVV